jgi:hypothetical protein
MVRVGVVTYRSKSGLKMVLTLAKIYLAIESMKRRLGLAKQGGRILAGLAGNTELRPVILSRVPDLHVSGLSSE